MEILQTVVFNLLVHKICSKQYPYICHKSINKGLFKDMMQDVKNVFAAKMSNYVYGSTDNIVVSVIISSASVGYLTNYTTIIAQLKNLIGAFLNPIIPFIGQKMVNVKERSTDDFYLYTEIRYVFFCIVGIPMLVLIKTFVSFCYGSQYIISDAMLILLVIDMYISIVYAPCYEYNNAVGLFKQERDVMIVAAVLNLGSSIILAFIMGMSGVLTGTVITQMYLWFSRSYIVFSQCFKSNLKEYAKYWKRNVYDGLCFIIIALICVWVYSFVNIDNLVFRFIVGGFLCEFIVLILYCAVQFRTKEFKKICKIIKNILKGTNK
jgi:O-antigen/teichoic acid export membrane protein